MKDKILCLFVACMLLGHIQVKSQTYQPTLYFTTEEMPDLLHCLPAPPDTNSIDFVNDIMRYMWGKTQRSDMERVAIARRDAVWNFDSLLAEFNIPFGVEISIKTCPEIYKFLINSLSTIDQIRVAPKAYYMRKRPFVYYQEHMLTIEEEESLKDEGSYPSGHSMRGWSVALLLSEVNPAHADTIMARGFMYGESRVIVGAHWQSDVEASRLGAAIGVARLHTSEEFLKHLHKAQKEFQQLQKQQGTTKN